MHNSGDLSNFPLLISELAIFVNVAYLLAAYLKQNNYSIKWMPISERTLIIVFLAWILLSIGIAYVLGENYWILSCALSSCLIVSLFSPIHSIAIFLTCFLLRPWELVERSPETLTYLPKIIAGVSLASSIFFSIARNKLRFSISLHSVVFAAFIAWLFLDCVFSPNIMQTIDFFFKHFYPIVVLVAMIVFWVNSAEDLEMLGITIGLAVCGVIMTASVETFFGKFNSLYEYRLHSATFWGNPNDLGALCLIALPLVFYPLIIRAKNFENWTFGVLICFVLVIGILLTQSRGALLGAGLASFSYFLSGGRKKLLLALFCGLIFSAGILIVKVHRSNDDRSTSDISRFTYAVTGFNMLRSKPIFGIGLGNYPRQYSNYSPEFYEWGERNAHSSWIQIMAETGLVGILLFLLLFGLALKQAWSIRLIAPEYLGLISGYGLAMTLLSHSYTFPPYLVIALILASGKAFIHRPQQTLI